MLSVVSINASILLSPVIQLCSLLLLSSRMILVVLWPLFYALSLLVVTLSDFGWLLILSS